MKALVTEEVGQGCGLRQPALQPAWVSALAGTLGSLFAVSSTFGDRAFPVSPQSAQSTYLKHAAGRLADDLFNQLKSECSGASACAAMFAPVVSVSTSPQQ